MTVRRLPPSTAPYEIQYAPPAPPPPTAWNAPASNRQPPVEEAESGVPWGRYIDALRRHTLFIAIAVAVGAGAGLVVAKRATPVYDSQATIWITSQGQAASGPIRVGQLLPSQSWIDLARSYAIVEPVVRRLRLNVGYKNHVDSMFFRTFESAEDIKTGFFTLTVDSTGKAYRLATTKGQTMERGLVGDSIGRKLGFKWLPPTELLKPRLSLDFWISSPRAVALGLAGKARISVPEDGQFLKIGLSGTDPQRTARTANAWAEQLVASSSDLKKGHLLSFKQILGDQLAVAEAKLRTSENELEAFRVSTITLPAGTSTGGATAAAAPDPLVANFFQQKVALDELRDEREALERIINNAKGGTINPQAFLEVPNIINNTPQLRAAIEELSQRQAALRSEQQFLTDENPRIKQLQEAIGVLEQETIPRIVLGVLATLKQREPELDARVNSQSEEIKSIPTRATEQMRLARQVTASENLYNSLKARYEEVSLSEAETTPDLSMLDYAMPALYSSSNDGPRLFMLALLASLGAALGVSLLHDRLDRRFRYPEQATKELGLLVAGTVPSLKPGRDGKVGIDMMSSAIESFRTLRLALRYDFPGDAPIVLSITSPSAGDGKSLISSNLALAFAGAGTRTLLIDGDVRRGVQHATFGIQAAPGLTEYLNGTAHLEEIVRASSAENLFVIPRGARHPRAPELLVSDLMRNLVMAMQSQFDVVIVDAPPLIAGMDAYALGAATGSMLLVMRTAVTDRKLAAAKLEVLDRLPIRILGTVLNAVPQTGIYKYYGSDYYYAGERRRDQIGDLATPGGLVLQR